MMESQCPFSSQSLTCDLDRRPLRPYSNQELHLDVLFRGFVPKFDLEITFRGLKEAENGQDR